MYMYLWHSSCHYLVTNLAVHIVTCAGSVRQIRFHVSAKFCRIGFCWAIDNALCAGDMDFMMKKKKRDCRAAWAVCG
jgi:hypothetical protein